MARNAGGKALKCGLCSRELAMRVVILVDQLARDQKPYRQIVDTIAERFELSTATAYRYVELASDVLALVLVPMQRGRGERGFGVPLRVVRPVA